MATRANTGKTSTCGAWRGAWWLAPALVLALVLALPGVSPAMGADAPVPSFVLVVHPDNPAGSLARDFVAHAFLKTVTRWGHGELIKPVDLAPGSATRAQFSQRVLKRSVVAMRSYWQQRIFSGRELPPLELDSDANVIRFVAANRGAIGYVSGNAKLEGVKVIALK